MRGIELIAPANTLQPATMMRTDRGLDALTYPSIDALKQATRHGQSLPAGRGAEARRGQSVAGPLGANRRSAISDLFPSVRVRALPPLGQMRERPGEGATAFVAKRSFPLMGSTRSHPKRQRRASFLARSLGCGKQRSSASGRAPSAWRSQSIERRGPAGLRDTHRGMPDESTTPDLVELVHRAFEAGGHRDIGALMSSYAPDAVCDMSPMGLGV